MEKESKKVEVTTQNDITELVFILDRSGSMCGLESDTIGGFNSMINEQKEGGGEVYVSTILFNTISKVLHDRQEIKEVSPLTEEDYRARGGTALLDAVGDAIKHISNVHKYARKEDVPMRTLFVITTDGMENASFKYTYEDIKNMITSKEKDGWEFLFLGANIDVTSVASDLGIRTKNAVEYSERKETRKMYETLNNTIRNYRTSNTISEEWAVDIDLKKRKK